MTNLCRTYFYAFCLGSAGESPEAIAWGAISHVCSLAFQLLPL
ncbi:MAG: hypothetical protein OJF50_000317 [Nitrospira sp.]|nr:hypothetical protein [Nitrospira sp.]